MAEGLDAGTVYVRVIPTTDSAANQQVGQQIGQQVQAAMNVRVGAGGGGGGMGGGGIGGGGTSGNLPVGVISAKFAAQAAEARLGGVSGGGNAYIGSVDYANRVALQSSWASSNMPRSAFDYRMQARSSNADRRIAEIESNVSTFSREPNAHVGAFQRAERQSYADAYSSGSSYGRPPDAQMGAYRAEMSRNQYLRATARIGPSAEFQDAFADLGRAVPPPIPQRTGINWKNAFMDPIGGRGGSGLFIHAAFGAAEVGHAYGASLAAQSPLNNRTSLQSMRSAKTAVDTVSGGLYGGILAGALRLRENSAVLGTAMDVAFPWLGITADSIAGPGAFNRMDAAMAGAEEGELNAAAGSARLLASSASKGNRAAIRDSRIVARIGNRFEQSLAANDAAFSVVGRGYTQGVAERRQAIAGADGPDARRRASLELNRFIKDEQPGVMEASRKRDVDNDNVRRDLSRDVRITNLPTSGLKDAAEGHFGLAGEKLFAAGLKRDELEAASLSGELATSVRRINQLKLAGRGAGIAGDIRQAGYRAAASRASSFFDTYGAAHAGFAARGDAIEAAHRSPGEKAALYDELGADAQDFRAQYNLGEMTDFMGQNSRLQRSRILSSSRYSYATASQLADVNDIRQGAKDRANVLNYKGKFEDAAMAAETGRNDLQAYKRQMIAGISMQEVSINRFAPGGGDSLTVLKSIDEGIKELNRKSGTGAGGGATAQ